MVVAKETTLKNSVNVSQQTIASISAVNALQLLDTIDKSMTRQFIEQRLIKATVD